MPVTAAPEQSQLLELTLKKLKKENKSIKEMADQIKLQEISNSQTMDSLNKQLQRMKDNEAVLVKELMQQQSAFQQTISENQKEMKRYETEVKQMQQGYETELANSRKTVEYLQVMLRGK